jgi:hypothetical protein
MCSAGFVRVYRHNFIMHKPSVGERMTRGSRYGTALLVVRTPSVCVHMLVAVCDQGFLRSAGLQFRAAVLACLYVLRGVGRYKCMCSHPNKCAGIIMWEYVCMCGLLVHAWRPGVQALGPRQTPHPSAC